MSLTDAVHICGRGVYCTPESVREQRASDARPYVGADVFFEAMREDTRKGRPYGEWEKCLIWKDLFTLLSFCYDIMNPYISERRCPHEKTIVYISLSAADALRL